MLKFCEEKKYEYGCKKSKIAKNQREHQEFHRIMPDLIRRK